MEYTTETYISERGNRITVKRPILTPEERAKRMRAIEIAAINLLEAAERAKIAKAQEDAKKEKEAQCAEKKEQLTG